MLMITKFSMKTNITGISETLTACRKLNYGCTTIFLNSTKSEVLLIGTPAAASNGINFSLHFDNSVAFPSSQVRNLGALFDSNLTLDAHTKSISKSAFFSPQEYYQD